eukprot:scaffold59051_cov16-Prasinocladus_malaysianus.AAC.1
MEKWIRIMSNGRMQENGTERNEIHWSGVNWMECLECNKFAMQCMKTGMEWNAMEWYGMNRNGMYGMRENGVNGIAEWNGTK